MPVSDLVLTPPEYMSPSSIETFRQCPLKYKFSKIDKIEDPPRDYTVLGNFVHSTLEDLFALPEAERTQRAAMTLLRERWDSEYQELAETVTNDLKSMKWKARWCIENYFQMEDPTTFTPGGVETEIPLIEVNGVPIKGFVDRWDTVGDGFNIVDYKSGKTPRPKYRHGKFIQLLIYADALQTMTGLKAKRLRLLFVADKFPLEKDVTQDDLQEMREIVKSARDGVLERCRTGEFEPVPQVLCDWCPYKGICPAWQK